MTLNCGMALILRYFTEFGSFRGELRKSVWSLQYLSIHSVLKLQF